MWFGDAAGRPRVIAVALMGLLPLMPVLLNPYWVIVVGSALCLEELVDGRRMRYRGSARHRVPPGSGG
ncbi:MAG: hypothetical protein HYV94_01680 [Candidatus Rokubacteria bacterium]|nr:hypothetical protein [Candidatus Rokubacteria bacterium]